VRVITSHIGSDFDSFSSMVAASKLYDDSVLCFSGAACRNLREFLKRFGNRWKVLTPRRINFDEVDHLVVVDARSRSRIGPFGSLCGKEGVVIHVYDHHPPVSDEIPAAKALIEPVGSTTTLIVERLIALNIPIQPFEATLFTMGIYEDTGALTFGSTTSRDFSAAARLRELGADLTIVPLHIEMNLNAGERKLLDSLIENARIRFIGGVKVALSETASTVYIEGISLFVHRLRDFFDADVALAVVYMENRTYIVARGRPDLIDVAKFLEPWGGGGHPQAASVTLGGYGQAASMDLLEKRLEECIRPLIRVSDVMSSPVMAVEPNLAIDDAYRLMIRYGHAALPVVNERGISGIITRKDLDKAELHGLGNVPVSDFMTEGAVTVSPEASVSEAHRMMVLYNIGRLPVVDAAGTLVGIVTRTDMLRALYPYSIAIEEQTEEISRPWTEDVGELMSQELVPWVQILLRRLGERAESLGMKAHVVGGFVRDLLLGRPNLDLDMVIEGDAVQFARSWERDGCRIAIHQRFKTGTIVFPGGRKVDVATARREFYEFPVAQPEVTTDSLKHDLYRRDYTVNAMAITVNPNEWGKLHDYFGGRRDLQKKTLNVLHNLSFVEDPTRVLRGVRLEQRLHFRIGPTSLRLLESCIRGGLISRLSGVRLRSELELILTEREPYPIVKRLAELGFWQNLTTGLTIGQECRKAFLRLSFFLKRMGRDLPDFGKTEWLAFLSALLMESEPQSAEGAISRLQLGQEEGRLVRESLEGLRSIEQALGGRQEKRNCEIYELLENVSFTVILFWAVATNRWRVRRRLLVYLLRLHRVQPMLTGRDLLDLGFRKGPLIGDILDGLKVARLEGRVETREEEVEWALTNFPQRKNGDQDVHSTETR
jgi:tRNA nucleotidyltransferase (CCA-adding enzyme)